MVSPFRGSGPFRGRGPFLGRGPWAGKTPWGFNLGGVAWSPSALFAANEAGAWYDPSDLTTLYQDAAGTTPVTAFGQPVALIRDKSGNGNDLLLTNASLRESVDGDLYIQYEVGGSATATFSSALGATSSAMLTMPSRQAYQVRTNINIGSTFTITESHAEIVLINRVLTPTEVGNLNTYVELVLYGVDRMPWTRNPAWLALPSVTDTEQKFVGLMAVFEEANYAAFTAAGAYTVDWGDGVVDNVASGGTALHQYSFTDAALANTNGPVTLNATGSLVERTAHGYSNGDRIFLWNVVTTTGVTSGQAYYVINATTDSFQISEALFGAPVVMTNNGSATLLNYKQAIITVTPQAGQNLTSLNLNVKHTASGLQAYETGWLDLTLSGPQLTSLTIGGAETVRRRMLERATILTIGSVTSMSGMFQNCFSLQSVPLFDTAAVTNMASMFNNCYSLQSVPLFNTAAVTGMASMFNGCASLQSVPLFDTAAVTSMSSMFYACYSLQSVPLFNTAAVTSMATMFYNCYSLQSVPLLNTAAVTNMATMFYACASLQSVPLFDTAAVTSMAGMFQNCFSLQSVPLFDTAAVTNMVNMFNGCASLQRVPAITVSAVSSDANFTNIFAGCNSIFRIEASQFNHSFSVANCKLSGTALDEIYTNLPTVSGKTITVTGNFGTATHDPTIATAKGWTVTV